MYMALLFVLMFQANAQPNYCDIANFKKNEIEFNKKNLKNLHVFKFRKLLLIGLGIGDSNTESVIELVKFYAVVSKKEKYCSFYLNRGNTKASDSFNHYPVPNPKKNNFKKVEKSYEDSFSEILSSNNLYACLEKGIIAMGCNSMEHRGPTVFGMLLSFSGCSPEKAAEIVNKIWGLNGVPESKRLDLIKLGYDLGNQNPKYRLYLKSLLEN